MWLAGFSYRKLCTITDYSADVHKTITVHAGTGTDTDTEVYCNNHAEVFPDDLRFALEDGTLIDYWIEEQGTDYAKITLELPSAQIYLYYGNAAASPVSSFDDTFKIRDSAENGSPTRWIVSGSPPDMEVLYVTSPVKNGAKSIKVNVLDSSPEKVARLGAATNVTKGRVRWWQYIPSEASGNEVGIELRASPGEGENRIVYLIFYNNGQNIKYYQNSTWYYVGATWQEATWELYEIRFNQADYSVSLYRYENESWTLLKSGIKCSNWTGNLQDFTVRHYSGVSWYTVFDDIHELNENTSPVFSWSEEEATSKEFTLLYDIKTEKETIIPYHVKVDDQLEFLYDIALSKEITFCYDLKAEKEFEIVYNVLVTGLEKELTMCYHVLQYIDFLIEISLQKSIQADSDTAVVIIPNDQLHSIADFDVANGEWVLERLINGQWERQFCGRCKETRLRSPPPVLEFHLYDYAIFLTQYYYTGVHNNKEAALILIGYGTSTQVLSLDSDSANWQHGDGVTLSDETEIKKEGSGSLKCEVTQSSWIQRSIQEDWSQYGRLVFWLEASQDRDFTLFIYDNQGNWVSYDLKAGTDWKEFYCNFSAPSDESGQMNWSIVSHIKYELPSGDYYLDDLRKEQGMQDENGIFANGVLYDMHVLPVVEYTGILLTMDWTQTRRLDACREVRDAVTAARQEPWECYVNEWKQFHFAPRKENKEVSAEISEFELESADLKIEWW